jgi:predicted RNase H-like HicB family nuclease
MTASDYHIDVFYSAEDQCWIANVPDLKYCSAHGPTPQRAVEEVMVALELWLEVAVQEGKRIPEPRQRPASAAN